MLFRSPAAIIDRLHSEITKLLVHPEMINALVVQGLDAVNVTPLAFNQLIKSEIDKWRQVVQAANIRVE